jgi:hypothetical protein
MKIERRGQSRVIIENVQPQVDAGLYPAKRTVGERVDVTADIFGDGHDHIRAEVLLQKGRCTTEWHTVEMEHIRAMMAGKHPFMLQRNSPTCLPFRLGLIIWIRGTMALKRRQMQASMFPWS